MERLAHRMGRLARWMERLRWMLVGGAIVSKVLLDLCDSSEVLRGVGLRVCEALVAQAWAAATLLLHAILRIVAVSKLFCRESVGHC